MRLISWNMAGAWGQSAAAHARAWEWLSAQDVDAALVQQAVIPDNARDSWDSLVWSSKYGHRWGSAVATRGMDYVVWEPTPAHPWLTLVGVRRA